MFTLRVHALIVFPQQYVHERHPCVLVMVTCFIAECSPVIALATRSAYPMWRLTCRSIGQVAWHLAHRSCKVLYIECQLLYSLVRPRQPFVGGKCTCRWRRRRCGVSCSTRGSVHTPDGWLEPVNPCAGCKFLWRTVVVRVWNVVVGRRICTAIFSIV